MRQSTGWLTVAAGGVLLAGHLAQGGEAGGKPPVSVNLDLPLVSAYVWRGQVLNDEAVVQPALNLSQGGFGLNVWGNYNLTDAVTEDPDFSEIDLTLSYGRKVGPVGLGAGLIEYLFPNTTLATDAGGAAYPGTRELYVSLSLPDLPVVPALNVYRDIDEADGFYASLSATYNQKLDGPLSLALNALLGAGDSAYNRYYFGVHKTKLNDACLSASLPIACGGSLTITPGILYSWLPASDIRDAAGALYKDDQQWVGSLKLNYVF